jgi:methionyl-tRNA formyltransferase
MPKEIVLLTGDREAPHLAAHLRGFAPAANIRHVATRAALDEAFAVPVAGRRLIAFTTNVIVPGRYLAACDHGGYNFHPGPPSYPGVYPESFAVWEKAARFGATAHRMLRQVDAGPIVATEWFDDLADALMNSDAFLPESGEAWTGATRLRSEFDAQCRIEPGISAAEYKRRYRAFGEGPFQDMHMMIHGHRFKIDNPWTEADLKREIGR